jgi:hypothetical protein
LKNYAYQDLVTAYNDTISTIPEAHKNPGILKNLMVNSLQSSGLKDKFELKQELDIQQSLANPKGQPPAKA